MNKVENKEEKEKMENLEGIERGKVYCIDCGNCIAGCCFINEFIIPDKSHLGIPSPYYHFGCDEFDRIITIERLCENFQKYGAYWSDWDIELKDVVIKFLIQEILIIKNKII